MSEDLVNASAAEVRHLATALRIYKQEVLNASKKARSAIGAAQWKDSRSAQFEARFADHQRQIDHFLSGEVDQMVKALTELARRLDEIRGMRM